MLARMRGRNHKDDKVDIVTMAEIAINPLTFIILHRKNEVDTLHGKITRSIPVPIVPAPVVLVLLVG